MALLLAWAMNSEALQAASKEKPLTAICSPRTEAEVKKLVALAKKGKVDGKVERSATFDVTQPADEAEVKKLDCHAVLVVTGMTHDPEELPLEASFDGIKLRGAGCVKEKNRGGEAWKIFGDHRMSCFFWIGLNDLGRKGELAIDWAKGRKDFGIGHGPIESTKYECSAGMAKPDEKAMQALIKRAYCVDVP